MADEKEKEKELLFEYEMADSTTRVWLHPNGQGEFVETTREGVEILSWPCGYSIEKVKRFVNILNRIYAN